MNVADQHCETGEFCQAGWEDTMKDRLRFILDYLYKGDNDEIMMFCDVDIQFFDSPQKYAEKALAECDIAFQNDYYGHACAGFFYMRNTEDVRDLFEEALDTYDQHAHDQEAINHLLKTGKYRYALLPPEFFTFGSFYNHWHGEKQFPIPDKIVMHHANWVQGIDKKIELLEVVRDLYNAKQCK